jgi:hypothetical protein
MEINNCVYIGHPMQGSVTNYIYVHNNPRSRQLEAGSAKRISRAV